MTIKSLVKCDVWKNISSNTKPGNAKNRSSEALAAYLNKPIQAGVLDLGEAKLVKSNHGDAFYMVTAKKCSCPAIPITLVGHASIRGSISA